VTGPIEALVADALACVAAEHPAAYAELERELGSRRLDLEIDDEQFLIELGAPALHGAVISVMTDVETLCALVHGERDVLDSILRGQLDLVAGPDDLVALGAAMTRFLQGAVRCVSMQRLLDRLAVLRKERTWTDR
jgi:hypothetical protein